MTFHGNKFLLEFQVVKINKDYTKAVRLINIIT